MGSNSAANIARDIVDLQDALEYQFMTALQDKPGEYVKYTTDQLTGISNQQISVKHATFSTVEADMARMMDMEHNSRAALIRTNELTETKDMIFTEQENLKNSRIYNKDLTRRQVEINNWYYENKRETLFVLQFVLLVVLAIITILYIAHTGWMTQDAADYLMGFILVVGAGLWVYRWYYTNYIRDPRYWSNRRFTKDGKYSSSGQICIGSQ